MLDVPINYMAIRWWEGQHPAPVVGGGANSGMEPEMWTAFYLSNLAMLLLFLYLLDRRVAVAKSEDAVEHASGLVHAQ
jgi:heme exporter protein C